MRYIAQTRHSKEVTLLGTADGDYWREHLRDEGLFPCPSEGRCDLLLSAVESRWMGVTFRELVLSVSVCLREDGTGPDGWYLVGAFNSSRLLAFIERTCFATPYRQGPIRVHVQGPVSFGLGDETNPVLHAELSEKASPSRRSAYEWEGAIFLPGTAPGKEGKQFFARIAGETEHYPFTATVDVVRLNPSGPYAFLGCLVESHFAGSEWQLRRDASHARSKTCRRGPRPA